LLSSNEEGFPYLDLAVQHSPNNPPAAWLWKAEDEITGAKLDVRVGGSFVWPPAKIEREGMKRAVFVAGGVGIKYVTPTQSPSLSALRTVPREH